MFGTKDEIFATVRRRYLDRQVGMLDQLIEHCGPGSDGVQEFLDGFAAIALGNADRNGCMHAVVVTW